MNDCETCLKWLKRKMKGFIHGLPVYGHIQGYLHRWRVLEMGRLSVRVHRIFIADRTPWVHTHPFHYISIVIKGGYTEQWVDDKGNLQTKEHKTGNVIIRSAQRAHRIHEVNKDCMTLFFAWKVTRGEQGWKLMRHPAVAVPETWVDVPDGLYKVDEGYRKRKDGMWYALRETKKLAWLCDRLSIRQEIASFQKVEEMQD